MELDSVPSEDEIGGYIPLERPSCSSMNVAQEPPRQPIVYSDEEGRLETSSDDSDDARIVKNSLKRKIPPKPIAPTDVTKKKKFNVWSEILQEDAIENQFNDSQFFGGCRGNETYNYRMKYFVNGNDYGAGDDVQVNDNSEKNDFSDVKNRPWAKRRKFNKKLKLGSLDVTVEDSDKNVALDIAKKLNEPKTDLIEKIVSTIGKEKAIEVFNKTKDIEQKGGYMTLDKSRRRTSGGVFLKLVKSSKLSRKQFDAIFKYNDGFVQKRGKFNKKKEKKEMPIDENESSRDDDYKSLPTRAELELSLCTEDNETNVLKNPPPSPVYPSLSQSGNPCPLSDLFPNNAATWSHSDSFNSDSNPGTYGTWSPKHSFDSDSASKNPSAPPVSPSYSPHSPTYSPTAPVNVLLDTVNSSDS
ncbi:phosphorylated adapter RNA export protein-like [Planococcus citri]|uniref:phosphorylated adapter RNA export protein-like n=1 Tax=Planococcus citri TaxID=170843 RepID=UPI0031F9EC27